MPRIPAPTMTTSTTSTTPACWSRPRWSSLCAGTAKLVPNDNLIDRSVHYLSREGVPQAPRSPWLLRKVQTFCSAILGGALPNGNPDVPLCGIQPPSPASRVGSIPGVADIEPYRIDVPDDVLTDLTGRLR